MEIIAIIKFLSDLKEEYVCIWFDIFLSHWSKFEEEEKYMVDDKSGNNMVERKQIS